MRFSEILQEYDRSKTAQQMGGSISQAAEQENQLSNLEPEQQVEQVLEKAESADPTPNKKYVLWIVRQFVKNELKFEDINEFLKKDITAFHELPKQRKQQLGIETDINRYTWRDIREIATKLKKATDLEEPVDAKLDYEHIDDMKVLYIGDMGQLIIPETEAASCEIGAGTKWCTAASQSDNKFSNYASDGPLYVWIPSRKMPEKKVSNKFQFHFPSREFVDEHHKEIEIESDLFSYFRSEHPVVKNAFAKGEEAIAKDPEWAYKYARVVIKGRFPAGEAAIAQDSKWAYLYADEVIKGRFPEGEAAIAQDSEWAYLYAQHVIKKLEGGNRFPAGEAAIAQDSEWAYYYARNVIEGRFPAGEEVIAQDARNAYRYAYHVIKRLEGENRWPAGEAAIAQDARWAFEYGFGVIKGRWPLPHRDTAEANIKKDSQYWWEKYVRKVKREENQ